MQALKTQGKKIYIVSEAAADIGAQMVSWLGLEKLIDGLYTYPSRKKPERLSGVIHKFFPASGESHLVKPHPLILAEVILDEAKHRGLVDQDSTAAELFFYTRGCEPYFARVG